MSNDDIPDIDDPERDQWELSLHLAMVREDLGTVEETWDSDPRQAGLTIKDLTKTTRNILDREYPYIDSLEELDPEDISRIGKYVITPVSRIEYRIEDSDENAFECGRLLGTAIREVERLLDKYDEWDHSE